MGSASSANTYAPGADQDAIISAADEYFRCRNRVNENGWLSASPALKAGGLIAGRDYIDKVFNFRGFRLTNDQNTEFPRQGLYEYGTINEFSLVSGIPERVIFCNYELAIRAIAHKLLEDHLERQQADANIGETSHFQSSVTTGGIKKTRAGSVEIEYFEPGTRSGSTTFTEDYSRVIDGFTNELYPECDFLMKPLVHEPTHVSNPDAPSTFRQRNIRTIGG